jgi:hypothetical protein
MNKGKRWMAKATTQLQLEAKSHSCCIAHTPRYQQHKHKPRKPQAQ